MQFYKNLPIGLIAFVLLQGTVFTREYSSGTLVLSLTKGLGRHKVVLAKSCVLVVIWSVSYWLCFGITYLYNSYFWDNSIAYSLGFSAFCWWLFGLFIISLMTLFSVISISGTVVLIGTGAVALLIYFIGFIPKVNKYLPTYLTDGNSLIYGIADAKNYVAAIIITAILSAACFVASVPIFNKKQL